MSVICGVAPIVLLWALFEFFWLFCPLPDCLCVMESVLEPGGILSDVPGCSFVSRCCMRFSNSVLVLLLLLLCGLGLVLRFVKLFFLPGKMLFLLLSLRGTFRLYPLLLLLYEAPVDSSSDVRFCC